jgi:hypothetical protein
MDDLAQKLAKQIEADLFAAIVGPVQKRPQTALRARGNGFEVVELDDAGNVVEPPPRCCYGTVLHAPNCKFWLTCT